MADTPPFDPARIKEANELYAKTLNIQREVEKVMQAQKNTLLEEFGVQTDIATNLIKNLLRTGALKKLIASEEKKAAQEALNFAAAENETKRREVQATIEGIAQRVAGYKAELESLQKIRTEGWGGIAFMMTAAWSLFKSLDAAAWEFRKAMGFGRVESQAIRTSTEKIAIDMMNIGVNAGIVYKSVIELGKVMGGVHNVSKRVVETTAMLNAQLGTSIEDSTKVLQIFAAIGGSTLEAQTQTLMFAQALSAAAGVSFNEIVADMSKLKGSTLAMISRMPLELAKATIELKKMGTNINETASAGEKLLNFTQNIQDEMEASVLLGHSFNLQKARQFAYERNLEGVAKEQLKLAKEHGFLNRMDYFQQKAFATALGTSVENLMSMVQTDRELNKALRDGTPEVKMQAAEYKRLKEMNEANAKALANNVEYQFKIKANQERITAITQKWNQILAQATSWLLPIIDITLSVVPTLIQWGVYLANVLAIVYSIGKAAQYVAGIMTMWVKWGGTAFNILARISVIGGNVAGWVSKVVGWFAKAGVFLGEWFPLLGKFISPFLKILGPIGWAITAFQAIGGAIKGWKSAEGGFWSKLGGAIMGIFRAIIPGFDYIMKFFRWVGTTASAIFKGILGYLGPIVSFTFKWLTPIGAIINGVKWLMENFGKIKDKIVGAFSGAWGKVKKLWGGHSPSEIGLSIIQGISASAGKVKDALLAPYVNAFKWILDKFSGIGKFFGKMLGFGTGAMEKGLSAAYIPAAKISSAGSAVVSATAAGTGGGATATKGGGTLADVVESNNKLLEAIIGLRKDLNDGKIAVKMDGQLLSATLARQTEFRGGYGVNKV